MILQRPDYTAPLRPIAQLAGALGICAAGVALAIGVGAYAKLHVHETMPRVVDCRADASTLDCQVAIDAAMFRAPRAPADGHFVVTIVDCNGLTWSLDNQSQQVTLSVDHERHCVQVRAYTMTVPGRVEYVDEPKMLTPADVRAKLGITWHP